MQQLAHDLPLLHIAESRCFSCCIASPAARLACSLLPPFSLSWARPTLCQPSICVASASLQLADLQNRPVVHSVRARSRMGDARTRSRSSFEEDLGGLPQRDRACCPNIYVYIYQRIRGKSAQLSPLAWHTEVIRALLVGHATACSRSQLVTTGSLRLRTVRTDAHSSCGSLVVFPSSTV